MTDVLDVVSRFLEALSRGDEEAARACTSDAGWRGAGDTPGRLFRQASAGGSLVLERVGDPSFGERGRVSVPVALAARAAERPRGPIVLLGEGAPFRLEGVAVSHTHPAHYLAGDAPARVVFEALEESPAAAAAARELGDALAAAADGDEGAAARLTAQLDRRGDERRVVGHLVLRCGAGARLVVHEARGLAALGRSAVRATLGGAGEEGEPVFLYTTSQPPAFYASTPFFSPTLLLEPLPDEP